MKSKELRRLHRRLRKLSTAEEDADSDADTLDHHWLTFLGAAAGSEESFSTSELYKKIKNLWTQNCMVHLCIVEIYFPKLQTPIFCFPN